MAKQSPTYLALLDLLFRTKTIKAHTSKVELKDGYFSRTSLEKTQRPQQDITISDDTLYSKCTSAEWHVCGRIMSELKTYNALWQCTPDTKSTSSSMRKAIKGLIAKRVLIPTETRHIYLVNPLYIRKGDFLSVLTTTAALLADSQQVHEEHIRNTKPVKQFTPGVAHTFTKLLTANTNSNEMDNRETRSKD